MDLDIMASVQEQIIGNCLCVLGDAMAMPIGSMIAKFRDEFEAHIEAARARNELRDHRRGAARGGHPRGGGLGAAPRAADGDLLDRRARGHRARELDARRRRQARRRRDPGLLLRAQARRAGRRLPHVPGRDRGHPQAADRLLDAGQGRHGRPHPDRPRQAGPGGGRRVPAHQPPARLPGLRQGRRVPAAGHLLRLGRRPLALHRAQAPLPEAARLSARWSRSTASAASSATAACASARRSPRTTSWSSRSAARTPTSRPSTATPTSRRSAATSSSCARWAR